MTRSTHPVQQEPNYNQASQLPSQQTAAAAPAAAIQPTINPGGHPTLLDAPGNEPLKRATSTNGRARAAMCTPAEGAPSSQTDTQRPDEKEKSVPPTNSSSPAEEGAAASQTESLRPEEEAAIRLISLGFRAGSALRTVLDTAEEVYGAAAWRSSAAQRALLAGTLEYAPAGRTLDFGAKREARFARLLLDEVERVGWTPDPAIVERAAHGATVTTLTNSRFVNLVLTTGPAVSDEITLRAAPRTGNLGLRLWEAGIVMYMCVRGGAFVATDIVGRSVLEIGSGLGLCAHALRVAGARTAVLTDNNRHVLETLSSNVRASVAAVPDAETQMYVKRLNVAEPDAVVKTVDLYSVQTILCADLTYDPKLVRAYMRAKQARLRPDTDAVFARDTGRLRCPCDGEGDSEDGSLQGCWVYICKKTYGNYRSLAARSAQQNCTQCGGSSCFYRWCGPQRLQLWRAGAVQQGMGLDEGSNLPAFLVKCKAGGDGANRCARRVARTAFQMNKLGCSRFPILTFLAMYNTRSLSPEFGDL